MVVTKQMNIKNRTYYFYNDPINIKDYNDPINIKDFDAKLLKLDKNINESRYLLHWLCHKKT